tara:strand:- start:4672 stop:5082 length:411 start_codon:yes stop_codon:yes gene_type:complete
MVEYVTFPTMPILRAHRVIDGNRRWSLVQNLYHNGDVVTSGFITDGASVPRLLWPLFPPYGKLFPAAIIHDWNYYKQVITRKQADSQFKSNMKHCGMSWITRTIIYRSVRLFGGIAWHRNTLRHKATFWENGRVKI